MFDDILDGLFKEDKEDKNDQMKFNFNDEESDEWVNSDVWCNNTADFVWNNN